MRRRILLLTVGMTTLVVLAFAIPLVPLIRSVMEQRNERAAVEQALGVGVYLRSDNPDQADLEAYLANLNDGNSRKTEVVLGDGTRLGATLPSDAGAVDQGAGSGQFGGTGGYVGSGGSGGTGTGGGTGPGSRDATLRPVAGGGQVAVLTSPASSLSGVGVPQLAVILVYLSPSAHTAGMTSWILLLVGVSIGLLLISAGAAEVLTRRIVRPLTRTAAVAHELSQGDLGARAPTTGPREVSEVASALNRLAGRIDELISEERETVADLSHRLRTPLTALRLEAESLPNAADADRIGERVSVMERTLTSVIHAARRPQREGISPTADATAVVTERTDFWEALADDQEREITRALPSAPVLVRTSPEDLAAALDALLENVFAHTPEGTGLSIRLSSTGAGAELTVSDQGPGFEPSAAVRGRSDRGSSGLGLDIARRCAEASGGSMSIGTGPSGKGASITLTLGPAVS
jgi:signal transduction histidine kinase